MKPVPFVSESLVAAGCASAAIAVQVVANAEIPNLPNLDFGNLTSTAILGWYAWHTTTRTIPQLVADFRRELQEIREAFRQELQAERETHRAEVLHLREVEAMHQHRE